MRARAALPFDSLAAMAALVAMAALAGCGQKSDHPATAGGCDGSGTCLGVGPGGTVGGGGGDAATDASDAKADATDALDTPADGAPTIVSVPNGTVVAVASFTQDPASGTADTEGGLFAEAASAGAPVRVAVVAGKYAFDAIDGRVPLTWLALLQRDATGAGVHVRTLVGEWLEAGTTQLDPAILPSYPDNLSQVTATSLGLTTTVAGKGTVVVQIVDAGGAPRGGVVGAAVGSGTGAVPGPYYDDGDGLTTRATGTGLHGTVAYLGVLPSSAGAGFPISLQLGGVPLASFSVPVGADAVTIARIHTK